MQSNCRKRVGEKLQWGLLKNLWVGFRSPPEADEETRQALLEMELVGFLTRSRSFGTPTYPALEL